MKNDLGKLIAIFALSTLLTISLALNIFTYSFLGIHNMEDFKQVLLSKELLDAFTKEDIAEDNTSDTVLDSDEDNNQVEENKNWLYIIGDFWSKYYLYILGGMIIILVPIIILIKRREHYDF